MKNTQPEIDLSKLTANRLMRIEYWAQAGERNLNPGPICPIYSERTAYICHPYRDNPEKNRKDVLDICRVLVANRISPIAPQLFLAECIQVPDENTAMAVCLAYVWAATYLLIIGDRITDGMRQEIKEFANKNIHGKNRVFCFK